MVIGISPDSNNISRKRISACGERITFDGAGDRIGQTCCFAARPFAAQPDIASPQISNNSSGHALRIPSIFFMLVSDGGHVRGRRALGVQRLAEVPR